MAARVAYVLGQLDSERRAWTWTALSGPWSAPRSCCRRRLRLGSSGRPGQQWLGQSRAVGLGWEKSAAVEAGCWADQRRQQAGVLLSLHDDAR